MSRAGQVWDNSAMESFFSSLKTERTARKVYRTREQARADVFDYIERFYNPNRRHSTLGYVILYSSRKLKKLRPVSTELAAAHPPNADSASSVIIFITKWRMNCMATSKRGESSRSKISNTEVPGQALGYGLQYTRLTQLLFEAPAGSFCSMEYLDDVAQQTDKGVRLIQSKSTLTANPVADRAKSLWKTLSNWCAMATDPDCDLEKTVFEIYVSRPVGGQIVEAFANARTLNEARLVISQARDVLWGNSPDFELKQDVAGEIAPYLERVFNADSACLEQIICNFHLTHGSGSPQTDIEAVIRAHPVSPTKVVDIADHMCGVVKRRVDELLEARRPAVIARDAFYAWYAAYLRKVDRDTVLLSRAKPPSEHVTSDHLPKIFVQQLDLIGLTFEDKLEAVSDYLMAAADRTDWAISGEVDVSAFDELNAALKRSWRNRRRTCGIEHSSKPYDMQGQALYSDCMNLTMPLQTMHPPGHFIPGCFHKLADDMSIGWHPDYEQQLKIKKAA